MAQNQILRRVSVGKDIHKKHNNYHMESLTRKTKLLYTVSLVSRVEHDIFTFS